MSGALVLVGLSGSGKSTVGRLIASRLRLPFVDTDRQVELLAGMSIAAIFSQFGEDEFRRREGAVVAEACEKRGIVATGGGAVLSAENRAAMRADNLVVWLDVPISILAKRLAGHVQGEERPLLGAEDPFVRLDCLSRERRAVYRASAHVRCAVREDAPSGSRRIAVDLARIYRAWFTAERNVDES